MYRLIIRLSLDGDQGSVVRNALAWHFDNWHVAKTATGTWEADKISPGELAGLMRGIWSILENPTAVPSANPRVTLDHFWMYTDRLMH